MDSGINSNFIPHDTALDSGAVQRSGSLADLLALIATVLFVASIVLGVGVFLYQQFLETSDKSKVDQLERAKAAFDPALIQELTRLDDRMRDADLVLGSHLSVSSFFHMLEKITLTTVSFRSLAFDAGDPQNITIKMDGVAQSVNSIALQADLFSKSGIIISPIFSNINREKDGVHFNLTAILNPSGLRYAQKAAASSATAGSRATINTSSLNLQMQPQSGSGSIPTRQP
ncbi:MAG: hypothetical protein Q7K40_02950 [bacterium]|nr:hypothetical protein [bacterium]